MRQPRQDPRLSEAPSQAGVVWVLLSERSEPAHELEAHLEMARRLAALKGLSFGGVVTEGEAVAGEYFVPIDTLVGAEACRALGIFGEEDLFGGVVPYGFVATKAITHPLVSDADPGVTGRRLLDRLQESGSGAHPDSLIRTVQR